MVWTEEPSALGKDLLLEFGVLGRGSMALSPKHGTQVVEVPGHFEMIGAVLVFAERQGPLESAPSAIEIACRAEPFSGLPD